MKLLEMKVVHMLDALHCMNRNIELSFVAVLQRCQNLGIFEVLPGLTLTC